MRAPLQVDFSAAQIAAASVAQVHELPFGLDFKLRPMSGLVAASVEAQVSQHLHAFRSGVDVLGQFGFDAAEAGLLSDEKISSGFSYLMLATCRACAMLEDWNLVDETGAPVPISTETVARLFHFGVGPGTAGILMTAFVRISETPLIRLVTEKNASAASPNTDSAEAAEPAPTAVH